VIYFYHHSIECFILIEFQFNESEKKFLIESIQFFKLKKQIEKYIEENSLNLMNEINLDSSQKTKINSLVEEIKEYLSGAKVNLYIKTRELNLILDKSKKFNSKFSKQVINWLLDNVPYGQTTTYSEIGKNINSQAYRAIGNILKKNPYPLLIPCHRVIRKNGKLGGFMGKKQEGWQVDLKRRLLQIEGHQI
jgi:methylated-DNA-[protein]-cysteine S-methyltransferase